MKRLWIVVIGLAAAGCTADASVAAVPSPPVVDGASVVTPGTGRNLRVIPTREPTATPPPTATPFPTATPDDPNWFDLTPGVERREMVVIEPRTGAEVRLHMVRLDPALIDFKVHYVPRSANTVSGWQEETGAWVVVNGGFFDGEFYSEGTVFVDGQEYGVSPGSEEKISVGGLFGVEDGEVSIVPLGRQPDPPGTYDFDNATEGYPMLLMPGGVPSYDEETGHAAERTVVGIDEAGRVIFIVIREPLFTLYELARTLDQLDESGELDLDVALNLDGGKSSGMEVWAGPEHTHWEAATVLPIVIAAYPRAGVPVVPTADIPPTLR